MKGEKVVIETSKLKGEPIYINASIPILRDEVIQYLSDFSSLQIGQKVRVQYQGKIVEGTVAHISPNKDSVGIQIGENTRLDGPATKVSIVADRGAAAVKRESPGKSDGKVE